MKPFKKWVAQNKINGLQDAGPAVVSDEKALHRLEGSRCDKHRTDAATDDALQLSAEVTFGEIAVFTTFPDDDKICVGLQFLQRFNQGAVALHGIKLRHPCRLELLGSVLQNCIAFQSSYTRLCLFKFDQFHRQFGTSIKADGTGKVASHGTLAMGIEDV